MEKGEHFTIDLLTTVLHLHTRVIANSSCRAGQRCKGPWGAKVALWTGTIPCDARGVNGGRVCRTALAKISSLALA